MMAEGPVLGEFHVQQIQGQTQPCGYPRCAPELRVTMEEWVDFMSLGQVRKTNTEPHGSSYSSPWEQHLGRAGVSRSPSAPAL